MNCTTGQIRYDLFQLNESDNTGLNVDCYLLTGEKRAVLIDSLQTCDSLYETVRRITDLPLDVIVLHGHGDHAGTGLRQFHEAGVKIWMDPADFSLLEPFEINIPQDWFTPLSEGKIFDLGGTKLETIRVAGHTPGSAVLLDEKNQRLFTSDAVGSGAFWMQIPGCIPLHEFRENLFALIQKVKHLENLKIYPGHRYQSPVQLNLRYLYDTLALTDQILNRQDNGEERYLELHGIPVHYREASYGMMLAYSYNPLNL